MEEEVVVEDVVVMFALLSDAMTIFN